MTKIKQWPKQNNDQNKTMTTMKQWPKWNTDPDETLTKKKQWKNETMTKWNNEQNKKLTVHNQGSIINKQNNDFNLLKYMSECFNRTLARP